MSSYYSSPDWVLSHWAHFTVRRLIYLCLSVYFVCFCFTLHSCRSIVSTVGWTWWNWSLILWPFLLQCFDTLGWVIWPVKLVPDITYNVFGGTINLTQSILTRNKLIKQPGTTMGEKHNISWQVLSQRFMEKMSFESGVEVRSNGWWQWWMVMQEKTNWAVCSSIILAVSCGYLQL